MTPEFRNNLALRIILRLRASLRKKGYSFLPTNRRAFNALSVMHDLRS